MKSLKTVLEAKNPNMMVSVLIDNGIIAHTVSGHLQMHDEIILSRLVKEDNQELDIIVVDDNNM